MLCTIFQILFLLFLIPISLYCVWLSLLIFLSLFRPKKEYPEADPGSFAVIICARNEETVIGQLVDSLNKQDYPKDKLKVFVVAHNCSDRTGEIAAAHGAEVLVRNHPEEKRKVDALQFGWDTINGKYPGKFDYYAVFDADALVHKDFFYEINKALATGADVAAGTYGSKNFSASIVSRLSGLLYHTVMANCSTHNSLGLPVNIFGSGYAVRMKWGQHVKDYDTMVGDFEFSTNVVMNNGRMVHAPKAIIYAEMPITWREGFIQRRRWSSGNSECFWRYTLPVLKKLPKLGLSGVKQLMEVMLNAFALCGSLCLVFGVLASLLQGAPHTILRLFLAAIFAFCLACILLAATTLKSKKQPLKENIGTILLFPFWVFLSQYFGTETMLFHRPLAWTPTKREDASSIEDMKESRL